MLTSERLKRKEVVEYWIGPRKAETDPDPDAERDRIGTGTAVAARKRWEQAINVTAL